jgi:hypothetical protein
MLLVAAANRLAVVKHLPVFEVRHRRRAFERGATEGEDHGVG